MAATLVSTTLSFVLFWNSHDIKIVVFRKQAVSPEML